MLEAASSPTCEVLGPQQRRWLAQQLAGSSAALHVVASSSVLAGSLGYVASDNTACSGDDWACYPRAQVHMLHTLANASGCVVVLTGDYHYSDLKVIQPGGQHSYAAALQTARLGKPVYQAMASGMTFSTAEHSVQPCAGSFREDLVGLRPGGACSYVSAPAFGMLEVDWVRRRVVLSIRNGTAGDGRVARGVDGSEQRLEFDLDTCR
jgi:alkaline phosphatase D